MNTSKLEVPVIIVVLAMATILATGAIHFIDTADAFKEMPYKGILFALNGLGHRRR